MSTVSDIAQSRGYELSGKRIVLGVTGSVSAYRSPDLARLLIRHGADVYPVMSDMAEEVIHLNVLEWATGHKPVTKLTGMMEHVYYTSGSYKSDLILIAPCTSNTISKIACGIADTTVTAYVASALGEGIPVVIAPAMHQTMFTETILQENIRRLTELGLIFVEPVLEENKAKLASTEEIFLKVLGVFTRKDLKAQRVLITAGPTLEHIDPVRVITNPSSGKMGVAIACDAIGRGALVTVVHGPLALPLPRDAKKIPVKTTKEMFEAAIGEVKRTRYQIVALAAAPADYVPLQRESKVETRDEPTLNLKLQATPKLLDEIKRVSPESFVIAFRAQTGLSNEDLVKDGYELLLHSGADLMAINDVGREDIGFNSEFNELLIVDAKKKVTMLSKAPKTIIARQLLDEVVRRMQGAS